LEPTNRVIQFPNTLPKETETMSHAGEFEQPIVPQTTSCQTRPLQLETEIENKNGQNVIACEDIDKGKQDNPCTNKTKPTKSWATNVNGKTSDGSQQKTISFASIMANEAEATKQQEKEKKNTMDELETDHEVMMAVQKSLEESSTDNPYDEEMRKAITMSLQEEQQPFAKTASFTAEEDLSSHEKEQIEQAIREADDQETAKLPNNETNLSSLEMEEIEQALRAADEEEGARSLYLALQLQREEERAVRPISRQSEGNVRVMTRSQLWEERQSNETSGHRELYGLAITEKDDEDHGFRINSTNPSGVWSRVDGATIVGPNNELRTKHDVELQGQANAQLLGLDFSHYDDIDQKLASVGNKAFNSFRHSMQKKTIKGVAAHGHGSAAQDTNRTRGGAMDPRVRLQISKAINSSLIDTCNGVVKEGKEAIVYHAEEGKESGGFDVAIKVFKRIQEFKQRWMYIDGDPRYLRTKFSQSSARKQLEVWTEKEFRNLVRANRAGVPVPTPLLYKENILFMRFLGEDGFPSPQLRELQLKQGSRKWTTLYEQTMATVKLLYQKSHLVHADLSEYNILVCPCHFVENSIFQDDDHDENALQIVLIDFGQAVDVRHLNSTEFLRRDLLRIKEFFDKKGVVATMKMDVAEEFVTLVDEESTGNNEDEMDASNPSSSAGIST